MTTGSTVDLLQLEQQYRGKRLPALVLAHTRTMTPEILIQAIRGTLIEFDESVRPRMESLADDYLQQWLNAEAFTRDLGSLLADAIADFRRLTAAGDGTVLDDKRLFDLFHASVLKLALHAHRDAGLMQSLKQPAN